MSACLFAHLQLSHAQTLCHVLVVYRHNGSYPQFVGQAGVVCVVKNEVIALASCEAHYKKYKIAEFALALLVVEAYTLVSL